MQCSVTFGTLYIFNFRPPFAPIVAFSGSAWDQFSKTELGTVIGLAMIRFFSRYNEQVISNNSICFRWITKVNQECVELEK
jgi:hypothetical protein